MKVAVVVFPGSNCDRDAVHGVQLAGATAELVWHERTDLGGADAVILPGGFAHGDYLRSGAIARFSPVMGAVRDHAQRGGLTLGICNGFQVLLESGLLPGAMLRNRSVKFQCEHVFVKVEHLDTPFTSVCHQGQLLRLPIAHGEGNYYAPADTIAQLERDRRVVFRYAAANGVADDAANPNGSIHNIAGICSAARNVVGLMPHPERACHPLVGSSDGAVLLRSLLGRAAA